MASNESRQTFAYNILTTYNAYNLDGIDIDWEYPGHVGEEGNKVDPSDSDNFLLFLQLLRESLPPSAKLSAATQTTPFVGTNGQPMTDVTEFAKVLDWILIMNYDVWDCKSFIYFGKSNLTADSFTFTPRVASETPGPNAPFYNACQNSTQPLANAVAAYTSWTAAGFPASQMVLGIPSYGYLSKSDATELRTRTLSRLFGRSRNVAASASKNSSSSSVPDSSSAPSPSSTPGSSSTPSSSAPTSSSTQDFSSAYDSSYMSSSIPSSSVSADTPSPSSNGTSTQGQANITVTSSDPQIQFRDLVRQGALVFSNSSSNSTNGTFIAAGGYTRIWDKCSNTPFLRSESAGQIITYDDPQSLGMKAAFVKKMGMLGANLFDVHGDTDQWDLIDSVIEQFNV